MQTGYLNYLRTELRYNISPCYKGKWLEKRMFGCECKFDSVIGLLALIISCQCDVQYKYRTHFQAFLHMFLETVD